MLSTILAAFYEITTTIYEMSETQVEQDNDFDADITEEEFLRILQERKSRKQ